MHRRKHPTDDSSQSPEAAGESVELQPQDRPHVLRHLGETYLQIALALARAADARDSHDTMHSERLATLAEVLARRLGLPDEEVSDIRLAGLLHDLGKIGVPEAILRKPGPLDESDWALVRLHPVIGEEILREIPGLRRVATIVRQHQECWDGTGYPDGLSGEQIGLGARILAVVDAYVTMTDERPYRPARRHGDALAELQRVAGSQLVPAVVQEFVWMFGGS